MLSLLHINYQENFTQITVAANHDNILIIIRLSIPYSLQKPRRFMTLRLISRNQYITGIDANTSK